MISEQFDHLVLIGGGLFSIHGAACPIRAAIEIDRHPLPSLAVLDPELGSEPQLNHQRRAGTGVRAAPAGLAPPTPRLIISCNSSGLDERESAVSRVINLLAKAFASP